MIIHISQKYKPQIHSSKIVPIDSGWLKIATRTVDKKFYVKISSIKTIISKYETCNEAKLIKFENCLIKKNLNFAEKRFSEFFVILTQILWKVKEKIEKYHLEYTNYIRFSTKKIP